MSRSVSPSARSTTSTSSITTLRNLYGNLADEFDVATLDALDFDVLFNPLHAFADTCYSDALADPFARLPSVQFSPTSSPSSTPPTSPVGKRRSMWVHNGLGALDESSEEDEDEEDAFRPPSYSTLDKIAPWADGKLRVQTRPDSMIQFRRPSGASTLLDIELSEPYVSQGIASKARVSFMDLEPDFPAPAYSSQKQPTIKPYQSLRFAPLPDVAPSPKSSKMKIGFGGLKRRL